MKRSILLMVTASALLALPSCGQQTETTQATTVENTSNAETSPLAAPTSDTGQTFANTAASSDAFELATSKLAGETSKSADVQAFAKQMITAHTDSTAKLKAAAASASPAITPDPTLTAEQQSKLAALQAKTGADFDAAYAAEQVTAHQMTLDALNTYAGTGDIPELKSFAANTSPIVAGHLKMARALKP
ncbi:MAG: DUF4142 domain-containing protein [Pseudomonadota bacterium]